MTTGPTLKILICKECYKGFIQVDIAGTMIQSTLTCPVCDIKMPVLVKELGQRIRIGEGHVDVCVFNLPEGSYIR